MSEGDRAFLQRRVSRYGLDALGGLRRPVKINCPPCILRSRRFTFPGDQLRPFDNEYFEPSMVYHFLAALR
jgi:hypothetical protein